MSSKLVLQKIIHLESLLMKQPMKMMSEEARKHRESLISSYDEFIADQAESFGDHQKSILDQDVNRVFDTIDPITKRVHKLQKRLKKFYDMNVSLDSLYNMQKLLIDRITLLEKNSNVCAVKAEILLSHVSSLYHLFVANQFEIEKYVRGRDLDIQHKVSDEITLKVNKLQALLVEKITNPNSSMANSEESYDSESYIFFKGLFVGIAVCGVITLVTLNDQRKKWKF